MMSLECCANTEATNKYCSINSPRNFAPMSQAISGNPGSFKIGGENQRWICALAVWRNFSESYGLESAASASKDSKFNVRLSKFQFALRSP